MPTIKDIANLAGVSYGTVYRVLHNRGRFSSQTAERVRSAAKELHYSPNVSARNLSKAKRLHLGVLIPYANQGDDYWGLPLQGMKNAVEELKGFQATLSVYNFQRDVKKDFVKVAQDMFSKECNGYLMAPVFPDESEKLLTSFSPKVPVVFFNTDIPGSSNRLCFIGQDSYRSGVLAAKLLRLLTREKPCNFNLVIRANEDNDHLKNRVKGFIDNSPSNSVKEIVYDPSKETKSNAYNKMLEKHITPDVTGIFVTNASVYRVAEYLEKNSKKHSVALIGCDLTKQNAEKLENESIDFILTQRPIEMGYESVYILYKKIILNENISDRKIMPIDIITKENYEFFV
jgi:LacI family transcriptional regulator